MDSLVSGDPYLDLWTFPSAVLFTSTTMVPVGMNECFFPLSSPFHSHHRIWSSNSSNFLWSSSSCLLCTRWNSSRSRHNVRSRKISMRCSRQILRRGKFRLFLSDHLQIENTKAFVVCLMITVISYPIAGGLIISHLGNLSVSFIVFLLQTKIIDLDYRRNLLLIHHNSYCRIRRYEVVRINHQLVIILLSVLQSPFPFS